MAAIAVRNLSIHRRGSPILTGVDLEIHPGERLGLLGRSGTGKTSLLRVMAGLDRPAAGSVESAGGAIEGPPEGMTMVFQGDTIYEHLDVQGNLAFSLTARERPDDLDRRIQEAAGRFFLTRILDRSPGTFSAGQRRAVSAARAMARTNVWLVLLDDPLVGADRRFRHRLVEGIMEDPELTIVFATREGDDALRWAERVAVLSDGHLAQVGRPMEVFRRPVSLQVGETLGELNRIPAVVSRTDRVVTVAGSRVSLAPEYSRLTDGRRVLIGVRPSDLRRAAADTPFSRRLRGTVGRVEPVGPTQRVLFGLGGHSGVGFCAEADAGDRISVGDRIDWSLAPSSVRLYDPVSGVAL